MAAVAVMVSLNDLYPVLVEAGAEDSASVSVLVLVHFGYLLEMEIHGGREEGEDYLSSDRCGLRDKALVEVLGSCFPRLLLEQGSGLVREGLLSLDDLE
jgi:hypothetical protein